MDKASEELRRGLEDIRLVYEENINAKISYLKGVYGSWIDSPEGCLKIFQHIFQTGTYHPSDPVFNRVDEEYHKLMKREHESKIKDRRRLARLNKDYLDFFDKLEEVNKEIYYNVRLKFDKKNNNQERIDLDYLEPSEGELKKLEKELTSH